MLPLPQAQALLIIIHRAYLEEQTTCDGDLYKQVVYLFSLFSFVRLRSLMRASGLAQMVNLLAALRDFMRRHTEIFKPVLRQDLKGPGPYYCVSSLFWKIFGQSAHRMIVENLDNRSCGRLQTICGRTENPFLFRVVFIVELIIFDSFFSSFS